MGQIVGTFSNIFRCNLRAIQSGGSKANTILAADEVWLIDTSNSLTNSFSGDCDYYIIGNGSATASELTLTEIVPGLTNLKEIVGEGISSSEEEERVLLLDIGGKVVNSDGKTLTDQSSTRSLLLYDMTGAIRVEVTHPTNNSYNRFYLLDSNYNVLLTKNAQKTTFEVNFSDYPSAKYISASLVDNINGYKYITLYYPLGGTLSDALKDVQDDVSNIDSIIFSEEMGLVEYDTSEIQNGFLNYGNFTSNGSCRLTGFIEVSGNEIIYITGKDVNNGMAYTPITCYGEEYNYLQPIVIGTTTPYTDKEVKIPYNAKYIKVCAANSTNPIIKRKIKVDSTTKFETEITENKNKIESLIPYTFFPKDLPFTIEKEGYRFVNASETAASAYCITNYIEVTAGKKLHICTGFVSSSSYRTGVWYNADKQAITYVDMTNATAWNDTEVTVPENAKYIRLATNNRYGLRLYYIGDTTPAEELMESQYHKISLEINNGYYNADGSVSSGSDSRYKRTEFNIVSGEKYKIRCYNYTTSVTSYFTLYNSSTEEYLTTGWPSVEYFTAPFDGKVLLSGCSGNNATKVTYDVWKYGSSSSSGNKTFNKTIHTIGHSFWNGDGLSYTQFGVTKTRKGYQSYFKDIYEFNSFDDLRYDGHSLGAQSASDSSSIALKLSSWTGTAGDIWCMDSITNDFKRNIPLGTLADNYNAAEPDALTYYGALRLFRNKVVDVSGSDAIVVVSNATHRNNSGYTSTSTNSAGCKLSDYSNALMCIAELEGWFFVDVFNYGGILDDNLAYTTIDGLHPNNLGYKLSVKPWIAQLDIIKEMYG